MFPVLLMRRAVAEKGTYIGAQCIARQRPPARAGRCAKLRRHAVATPHGALHESRERLGVLARELDAVESVAHDGPEGRHLPRTVHRVAAAGVGLVRPRHRGGVRGAKRLAFGIDAVELALEHRDPPRVAQPAAARAGRPVMNCVSRPPVDAYESVAAQATWNGRSVTVKPGTPSASQKRLVYSRVTLAASPRSRPWIIGSHLRRQRGREDDAAERRRRQREDELRGVDRLSRRRARARPPASCSTRVTGAPSRTRSPSAAAIACGRRLLPPAIRIVSDAESGTSATTAVCCATNSIDSSDGSALYSARFCSRTRNSASGTRRCAADEVVERLAVELGGARGALGMLRIDAGGERVERVAEAQIVGQRRRRRDGRGTTRSGSDGDGSR